MWTASTGPPTPAGILPGSGVSSVASLSPCDSGIPLPSASEEQRQDSQGSVDSLQPFSASHSSPRIPNMGSHGNIQLDLSALAVPAGAEGGHQAAVTLVGEDSDRDSYSALSPTGGTSGLGGGGSPRMPMSGGGGFSGRSLGGDSHAAEATRTTQLMGSARSGQSMNSGSFGTEGDMPFTAWHPGAAQGAAPPAPIARIQLNVPAEAVGGGLPPHPQGAKGVSLAHMGGSSAGVRTFDGGDSDENRSQGGLTNDESDGQLSSDSPVLSPQPRGLIDAAPSLQGSGVQIGVGAGLGVGEISYSPPPSYVAVPFRVGSPFTGDRTGSVERPPVSSPESQQARGGAGGGDLSLTASIEAPLQHLSQESGGFSHGPGGAAPRATHMHLSTSGGGGLSDLSSSFASDSFEASGGHFRKPSPPHGAADRQKGSPHSQSAQGTTVTMANFTTDLFGHSSPPKQVSPPGGPSVHTRTSPRGGKSTLKPTQSYSPPVAAPAPPRPPAGGLAPIGGGLPRALAPIGGKAAAHGLAPLGGGSRLSGPSVAPVALPVGNVRLAVGGRGSFERGEDTSTSVSYSAVSRGMSDVVGLRNSTASDSD